ncbi:SANT/Myb-like DNA-binding domain-containing protein ASCRUDRAFT_25587, partial [Ascoidea rubescens DSM 1968]
KQKLSGLNRELYSLLGPNTPSIQLNKTNTITDQKKLQEFKVSHWVRLPFKNNSRLILSNNENDRNLSLLKHWVKNPLNHQEIEESYPFEKYNVSLRIPTFDRKIYDQFIESDDESNQSNTWSYEETQYLFDICKLYDLKWVIIKDRYDFKNLVFHRKARLIEDLKERFYHVSKQILLKTDENLDIYYNPDDKKNLIQSLSNFDRNNEINRKLYLERLLNRNPAEIAEEESLIIEAKKYEQNSKKIMIERAQLLQLLDTPKANGNINAYKNSAGLTLLYNQFMASNTNNGSNGNGNLSNNNNDSKNKNGNSNNINRNNSNNNENKNENIKNNIRSSIPADYQQVNQNGVDLNDPISRLLAKHLSVKDQAMYGIKYHGATEKLSISAAHLRSSRIATYKTTLLGKINATLTELGIALKPCMPTSSVIENFDLLNKNITLLLEAKKQCDKLEADVKAI